ncbi:unnamed protein product [Prorocentrum cordatum]|uniref:Uncharacterized protein n=1 Tax=Prorocentrum cordatum TaxID=2364126 RepID=A0ABN9Y8S3_9DINO|nr:unnamed protein product [Polarella glacialis]
MPPHITVTPEDGMRQPWTGNDRVDRNLFAMDRAIEVRQSGSRVMSRAHVGRTPAGDASATARAGKPTKPDRDRRKLVFPQVQEHQLAVEGEQEAVTHDRQMEASKNRLADALVFATRRVRQEKPRNAEQVDMMTMSSIPYIIVARMLSVSTNSSTHERGTRRGYAKIHRRTSSPSPTLWIFLGYHSSAGGARQRPHHS